MTTDKERKTLEFINSCQKPEGLLVLPLTPPQAHALFQYRGKYGHLDSLDELLKVRGIGKRTLEKVKDWIAPAKMGEARSVPSRQQGSLNKLLLKREFLGLLKNSLLDYRRQFILARKQLRQGEEAVAFFSGRGPGYLRVLILVSTQRILVLGGGAHIFFSCAVSNTEEQIGMLDLKGRYCSVMFLDNENSTYFVVSRAPIKIASRVKLLIDGPKFVGSLPGDVTLGANSIKGNDAISWRRKAKAKNVGRKTNIEHHALLMFYVSVYPFLFAFFFGILGWLILLLWGNSVLGSCLSLIPSIAALLMIIAVLLIRRKYNKRCFSKRLSQAYPGMGPTQVHRLLQHLEKHGSIFPLLDGLNGGDYEKQTVVKSKSRWVSSAGSKPSAETSSKGENVDFTRKQAVWTAIIGYFVLYSPLYYLGRISHGWFIGCAVVGSILGALALLAALGSLLSGQKRTAIAVSVVALGVVVALGTAFDDLSKPGTPPVSEPLPADVVEPVSAENPFISKTIRSMVMFDGTMFTISNLEDYAWKSVTFKLNRSYTYTFLNFEAQNAYSIGAMLFTNSANERFNPFLLQPDTFYIILDDRMAAFTWVPGIDQLAVPLR